MLHLFLLSYLILKVNSHTGSNTSDIIVINSGHSDAGTYEKPIFNKLLQKDITDITTENLKLGDTKDDVVFIPNEDIRTYEDRTQLHADTVNIKDVLTNRRTVSDILNRKPIQLETETPPDIVFITGKNNENIETEKPIRKQREKHSETRRNGMESDIVKTKSIPLNCTNLDCNNTLNSICGGKLEHKQWKYRLFLNDCYFRKVNCGFKYAENRYTQVLAENCIKIAGHYSERPYIFKPQPRPMVKPHMIEPAKNSSARRSLPIGADMLRCAHVCPLQCTNDHQPECAVTASGEKRVFGNHCKLDHNSCVNGIVWRRRPMADCVGGKMSDVHQNRAFIDWMQRVGIVDNRGRLALT